MIKQVQIGPVTYSVTEQPKLMTRVRDGSTQWVNGCISPEKLTIEIEADNHPDVKLIALWHEAIHGILDQAGHTDHPELLVLALGYGLVQLVRDNPELVALTLARAASNLNEGGRID